MASNKIRFIKTTKTKYNALGGSVDLNAIYAVDDGTKKRLYIGDKLVTDGYLATDDVSAWAKKSSLAAGDVPTLNQDTTGTSNKAKALLGSDTRAVNSAPSVYMSGGARWNGVSSWENEFKQRTTIGSPSNQAGTYVFLQTLTPWSNNSGGYPIQISYGNGSPMWRIGTGASTWSGWRSFSYGVQAEDSNKLDGQLAGYYAKASDLSSYVKTSFTVNGKALSGNSITLAGSDISIGAGDVIMSGSTTLLAAWDSLATTTWVNTQLNSYALDSAVVKLTGNQSIAGVKTFTGTINTPLLIVENSAARPHGTFKRSGYGDFNFSRGFGAFAIDSPDENYLLRLDLTNRVGIGVGDSTGATQKLDVNGKIRMRTQTASGDGADIVATKGYVDSEVQVYTAGTNVSISNNVISAVNHVYTSGTNVDISGSNVISATDTKYSGGTGITLSGTTFSHTSHTGDVTGSTSLTIGAGKVTAAKLASNAVETAKIKDGNVTKAKLASGSKVIVESSWVSNSKTLTIEVL